MRYAYRTSREGKRTIIEFPDCPGCQTFTEPRQDVAAMAADALIGWLEAHLVRDRVPPPPRRHTRAAGHVAVPANLAAKIILRRARVDAGLSQAELARRAGITQPSVAKLENPDHELKLATLERVLAVLGMRVELAPVAA